MRTGRRDAQFGETGLKHPHSEGISDGRRLYDISRASIAARRDYRTRAESGGECPTSPEAAPLLAVSITATDSLTTGRIYLLGTLNKTERL